MTWSKTIQRNTSFVVKTPADSQKDILKYSSQWKKRWALLTSHGSLRRPRRPCRRSSPWWFRTFSPPQCRRWRFPCLKVKEKTTEKWITVMRRKNHRPRWKKSVTSGLQFDLFGGIGAGGRGFASGSLRRGAGRGGRDFGRGSDGSHALSLSRVAGKMITEKKVDEEK